MLKNNYSFMRIQYCSIQTIGQRVHIFFKNCLSRNNTYHKYTVSHINIQSYLHFYTRDIRPPTLHTITLLEDLKKRNSDLTKVASILLYLGYSVPCDDKTFSL